MKAEEKAKELVDKFTEPTQDWDEKKIEWTDNIDNAKQCALIAVDEILKVFEGLYKPEYTIFDAYEPKQYTIDENNVTDGYMLKEYFQQVKEEITKL